MSAGYTPGPWITWGDGIVRHEGRAGVLGVKLGSAWQEDAWCGDDADAETLANASLIASAPEMMEALQEAVCLIPASQKTALAKFSAVIAKARGQS